MKESEGKSEEEIDGFKINQLNNLIHKTALTNNNIKIVNYLVYLLDKKFANTITSLIQDDLVSLIDAHEGSFLFIFFFLFFLFCLSFLSFPFLSFLFFFFIFIFPFNSFNSEHKGKN